VQNGDLILPKGPGLGFEFDEQAIAKYAFGAGKPWLEMT
jgi:L-alanine-DL-glutamate epimerase-like enolase superfamily enzyme